MSPHLGGLQISWEALMEFSVPDRNIIIERIEELRDEELDMLKKLHAVK
jgi:hypothetical protein